MKALIVVGSDLSINSSANLCHTAYINGLLNYGCDVDVLTAGEPIELKSTDDIRHGVHYFVYPMDTLYEKAGRFVRRFRRGRTTDAASAVSTSFSEAKPASKLKRIIHSFYGPYEVYSVWGKRAKRFKSAKEYDIVISLAFPPVSHFLANKLLSKKNVKAKRWIQLWEDPWSHDLVFRSLNEEKAIKKAEQEEKRLLSLADEIMYVSPLTLMYQKQLFPESAEKMSWLPVPTYYSNCSEGSMSDGHRFGYFGDYSTGVRNLTPFYEAAKKLGIPVSICGYSDKMFESTDKIEVRPRISLDELRPIEDKTSVLVFLCNLRGGQIPGKIYQYSATNKTILFIMDGTEKEKEVIREFFGCFDRYVFCENNEESIIEAIKRIIDGEIGAVRNCPVKRFEPTNIIDCLINKRGITEDN